MFENAANNKKETTRFLLKDGSLESMSKALEMMKELNKIEEPYERDGKKYKKVWRIGKTTDKHLVLDIDSHDEKNLARIMANLHVFFPQDKFVVIKTLHPSKPGTGGYQIIDQSETQFRYKNLKVLNMTLSDMWIEEYSGELKEFLNESAKADNPLKNHFNDEFKKSDLCNPIGDFDYLYNVLGIVNGHYTLRLTKKDPDDKWELI